MHDVHKTDLDVAQRLGMGLLKNEPNWITGDLGNYVDDAHKSPLPTMPFPAAPRVGEVKQFEAAREGQKGEKGPTGPVQQSDLLKPLLMDIARKGLNYAFQKWIQKMEDPKPHSKTKKPKKVIVVGAGMAGLVAAFELAQVGHDVIVLESQTRLGGRVYTLGEKDGFAKGLHCEGKKCSRLVITWLYSSYKLSVAIGFVIFVICISINFICSWCHEVTMSLWRGEQDPFPDRFLSF